MLIGKNWKIESTSLNVILSRLKTVKPKDKSKAPYKAWEPFGYYARVSEALEGLVEQGVRDTELKDLRTVVDKIDELRGIFTRIKGV